MILFAVAIQMTIQYFVADNLRKKLNGEQQH